MTYPSWWPTQTSDGRQATDWGAVIVIASIPAFFMFFMFFIGTCALGAR